MKPGNDLGRAGLSLFAGCESYCASMSLGLAVVADMECSFVVVPRSGRHAALEGSL